MESIVTVEHLMTLPFDSYCSALSLGLDSLRVSRKPTNVIDDVKTGEIGFLFYWYHDLMVELVAAAINGEHPSWYLHKLNSKNTMNFLRHFKSSHTKLDRLHSKNVKKNMFDEVYIKDGKLKQ